MYRLTSTLVAAMFAALFVSSTARAADLQVSYTVDDKALKTAISGTPLTFELYSDSACTTLVDGASVNVDDVDLIERVKRFKPTGGVKPPSTARLTEVLAGVSTAQTVYLKVTGTGITPVGGTCQLQYASADTTGAGVPCLSQVGNEVTFSGCNVNIRSGGGATDSAVNGLGNLIIGYNEDFFGSDRSGSHNLVIGQGHTYSNYGGLVAGHNNIITGPYASVSGGLSNVASGPEASVTGGLNNLASGFAASVTGGNANTASGNGASATGGFANIASTNDSSVSGGQCNVAGAGPAPDCSPRSDTASVSGGFRNVASGPEASVTGGHANTAGGDQASVSGGDSNTASGLQASVSGGDSNTAIGDLASVSGGQCNVAGAGPAPSCTALTARSSVSGGFQNVASGDRASVSGGVSNIASGLQASVSGGYLNEARDNSSSVLGGQCNVAGPGPKKTGCFALFGPVFTTVTGGFQNLASGNHSSVNGGNDNIASGGSSVVSSGNGTTQSSGFGWSAGAFGSLVTGKFSSP